ncbi:MAG: TetR/AcrR family transcriptional regulator [Acidimicrobiales bacterium]
MEKLTPPPEPDADPGSAGGARTSQGERSRRAILKAAEERFRLYGSRGTRLVDVTSDAGLTTGSLYRHFSGKDDLHAALFDEYRADVTAALRGADDLSGAIAAWVQTARTRPGVQRSAQEDLRPGQPHVQRWNAARNDWEAAVGDKLPLRLARPTRVVAAALVVDAMEYYVLAEAAGWFARRVPEAVGREVDALITGGLYSKPSPPGGVAVDDVGAGVSLEQRWFQWSPGPDKADPSSNRGHRTFDRLRQGAEAVFAELGFHAATMADIARRAGVSTATAYRYFEDKEDLFLNLVAETEDELAQRRMYPLDAEGRHPTRAAYEGFLQLHRDHAGVFLAWAELIEPASVYERAWVGMHEILMERMEKVLRLGVRKGLISEAHDLRLAVEIYGGMHERSGYTRVSIGRDLGVSDAVVADVVDRIFHGGLS